MKAGLRHVLAASVLIGALAASTVIVADMVGPRVAQPQAQQQRMLVQAPPRVAEVAAPSRTPARAARRCGAIRSAEVASPCPRPARKAPAAPAPAPARAPAPAPAARITPVEASPAPAKAAPPAASPAPKASAER